ncbi:hypothetical protein PO002_35405, partial [Cupriavidus necator]|uniref:hypothetical protein n=1 Tax=Cupriavidus necator TaxID=106590 RepID=UPI0039C2FD43
DVMTATTQTLTDDVLAVFRRACDQEQYVVADLLLSALEAMAGQDQDSRQLDEAYLVVAHCCAPACRCAAWDSAPASQTSASYTEGMQGQTASASGRTSGTRV